MPTTPLNVLLLVIDDLRPELAAYGFSTVTPHFDAFASSALTFTRAYVQYSHCSPSRNSFLSGRSPQTTGGAELRFVAQRGFAHEEHVAARILDAPRDPRALKFDELDDDAGHGR